MTAFFPPDALIRRISAEPALMFGAGRALLLQLAHPAVAQGVADHSDFKRNPFARLQGTLEAMVAVVYGSEEVATGVGRRIQRIHDFVVGPGYAANDPANLLWVHATLVDTVMRTYGDLVRPLTDAERRTYYEEMARVAEVFGVPRPLQPATVEEFDAYVTDTIEHLEVTATGRDLAAFIARPELPLRLHVPLAPALGLHRLFTLGSTPPSLRQRFGFGWTGRDELRYRRARHRLRTALRVAPYAVRTAPNRVSNRVQLVRASRRISGAAVSPYPADARAAGQAADRAATSRRRPSAAGRPVG